MSIVNLALDIDRLRLGPNDTIIVQNNLCTSKEGQEFQNKCAKVNESNLTQLKRNPTQIISMSEVSGPLCAALQDSEIETTDDLTGNFPSITALFETIKKSSTVKQAKNRAEYARKLKNTEGEDAKLLVNYITTGDGGSEKKIDMSTHYKTPTEFTSLEPSKTASKLLNNVKMWICTADFFKDKLPRAQFYSHSTSGADKNELSIIAHLYPDSLEEQFTDRIGYFELDDSNTLTWTPFQYNFKTFLTRYQKETEKEETKPVVLQAGDILRLQANDLEITPNDHILFYFE